MRILQLSRTEKELLEQCMDDVWVGVRIPFVACLGLFAAPNRAHLGYRRISLHLSPCYRCPMYVVAPFTIS